MLREKLSKHTAEETVDVTESDCSHLGGFLKILSLNLGILFGKKALNDLSLSVMKIPRLLLPLVSTSFSDAQRS